MNFKITKYMNKEILQNERKKNISITHYLDTFLYHTFIFKCKSMLTFYKLFCSR